MKHTTILRSFALIALAASLGTSAFAQILIKPSTMATAAPNNKAMLDLDDVTRGFLAPRVVYAQRPPNVGPVPANSLLIYQTDSSTVTGEPRGFYYWDATVPAVNKWVHASSGAGWKLGGNANTNAATNFIGTTNNVAMVLRTNGLNRMQLNPTGQVQIGTTGAVNDLLEVNGAVKITGTSAVTATEGAIRFNAATGAHEGYVNNPLLAPQIQYVGWYQLENVFKTRVKQKYMSTPISTCAYPAPVVIPSGATPGSWPLIDSPILPNLTTAATTETPYSLFWEDGRHQYLYLGSDLQALNVCPLTDVKGIAFQTSAGGSALGMRNIKINMKNTTLNTLVDFDYAGLQLCYQTGTSPALVTVNGWNSHVFNVSNWQWLGPGINMLVEYCFDNQDWTTNTPIYYENMPYGSMYGLYCDACGHPTFGSSTCYYTGPCNGNPNLAPGGVSQLTPGTLCIGWGWNGLSGGGCAWTTTTSLTTCDGTFQYQGFHTAATRRPILKIDAQTNAVAPVALNRNYLLAQEGVMIGNYTAWANAGTDCNTYQFKGPGTLAAQSSVWGGTVLLSDHVFDSYYDGKIKPEDAEQAKGYMHYPIDVMANYVERERHLPTMDGRDKWNTEGLFSLDHVTNQLWVTVEEQSLYIKELNERMDALQNYLIQKRLKEAKKN